MIQQAILWGVLYPITLIGFALHTALQIIWFLFNSPVDIWHMIGESLNEMKPKEKQRDGTDNQRL
jgi:hypothetical protein